MRKPIRLALFDLGSTLIYENAEWDGFFPRADAALWDVLHQAGVKLEPRDLYGELDTLFSLYYLRHRNDLNEPTTLAVLGDLLHEKGYDLPSGTLRAAMRAMYAVTQANWRAEEDAAPTLEALRARGIGIGLISNAADDENTQTLIDQAGLRPYLDFVISSAAFGRRKPDPGIFRLALDHFASRPEESVMVGDTYEADIVGAHGAGMQSIWITRRVRELPGDRPIEPDAIVTALAEIPALL